MAPLVANGEEADFQDRFDSNSLCNVSNKLTRMPPQMRHVPLVSHETFVAIVASGKKKLSLNICL